MESETAGMVSVVFSFRNEEENIPELVRRVQAAFKAVPIRYEMIFVNDLSTDRSLEVLQKQRESDPCIRIINLSRRFGVTPGVLAGFHHARGDAVICMDADLQDPPELIPALIQKWREGADVVHTTRTVRHGENAFKMWLTRQAYRLINSMADITILENTGDFKLISRRALNELLKLREFDPFMRGLVSWVGFRQAQVFYERQPRFAGQTHFSLWRSLNPYKEFTRGLTTFSSLPLYFALVAGMLTSVAAFVYLFAIMIYTFCLGHGDVRWAILAGIVLFMGGGNLLTVGILGIYIGRMHREGKGRPNYIVEGLIGFEDQDAPMTPGK